MCKCSNTLIMGVIDCFFGYLGLLFRLEFCNLKAMFGFLFTILSKLQHHSRVHRGLITEIWNKDIIGSIFFDERSFFTSILSLHTEQRGSDRLARAL